MDRPDLSQRRCYEEVARIAERGGIDMIFFGDGTGIPDTWQGSIEEAVRWGVGWPRHDMSPFIAAMSRVTNHVGFGLTYASTFMHPFYVARLLNSLDHVTNGRIAFNVIASQPRRRRRELRLRRVHGPRLALRADGGVHRRLPRAVEQRRSPTPSSGIARRGIVADPAKVHAINHVGKFFKVRGPLNCVPSPQGRPVLIQAGGSPRGIKASAHIADHIFGVGRRRR